MKTSGTLTQSLDQIANEAQRLEQQGADVATSLELGHDPMLQLAIAATSTKKIRLMTSIIVAFARSPMTMALAAHDVNSLSKGRLTVGLGSQIKPHIEKRYSMPWSNPANRMREYVLAMKAIWASWYQGEPLNFKGDFYTHTLMTPMFTPPDRDFGAPSVMVAAVGPLMTERAAEVADGVILHAFTTEQYIREVTLPAIAKGLALSGRSREQFEVVGTPILITGETEEKFLAVKCAARKQLAFYASTPIYRAVLDSVGYGELQPELTNLSKMGRWDEMSLLIEDGLLEKLALVGTPKEICEKMESRYSGIFNTVPAGVFSGDSYGDSAFHNEISQLLKSV